MSLQIQGRPMTGPTIPPRPDITLRVTRHNVAHIDVKVGGWVWTQSQEIVERPKRRFPVAMPRWERRRMVATKRKMDRLLQITRYTYIPEAQEAIW